MAPKAGRRVPKRFSRTWVLDNPELFREISTPPQDCPVCMQKMRQPRSPLLGDHPTSCRHFCCRKCWRDIFCRDPPHWKCPICREPLTQWLADEVGATVRIDRFDRHLVREYVCATARLFGHGDRECPLMFASAALLQQAESSDEGEAP